MSGGNRPGGSHLNLIEVAGLKGTVLKLMSSGMKE